MDKKESVVSNLFWKFAERIGAQAVTLIVSIVLARILLPEHYGTISIILIFINLANVFVSDGFTSALIQKKDADALDFSTIFYFNILFSLLLYGVIFLTAPAVESFFAMPQLSSALRILALKIPITAFNSVQHAYVAKHMMFRKLFWATLGGTLVSAVVGIYMALHGFGVYALVAQYLTGSFINTVVLWFIISWRPMWSFSWSRLSVLYHYGWKILMTYLIRTLYDDIYSFAIGKKYTSTDLAYYTKGKQYPNLIVSNLNTTICSVLFPAMSKYQEDFPKLKDALRRSIRTGVYVLSPCLIGFAVTATSFVTLVLTEKWIACVPYLQIVCLYQLTIPVSSAHLQAIKAIGKSGTFMKMEIIKRIVGTIMLIVSIPFGVLAIAAGAAAATLFNVIVDTIPDRRILQYSYREQLFDIVSSIWPSVLMGVVVYALGFFSLHPFLLLLVQVGAGALVFVGLSWWSKNESFTYLFSIVRRFLPKRKKQSIQ